MLVFKGEALFASSLLVTLVAWSIPRSFAFGHHHLLTWPQAPVCFQFSVLALMFLFRAGHRCTLYPSIVLSYYFHWWHIRNLYLFHWSLAISFQVLDTESLKVRLKSIDEVKTYNWAICSAQSTRICISFHCMLPSRIFWSRNWMKLRLSSVRSRNFFFLQFFECSRKVPYIL